MTEYEVDILRNGIKPEIKNRWGVFYKESLQTSLKRLWFFDQKKSRGKRKLVKVYDFNDVDIMKNLTLKEIAYRLDVPKFILQELKPGRGDGFRLWKGHVENLIQDTLLGGLKNWFYQEYGLRLYHFQEPRLKPNGQPSHNWVFRLIVYTPQAAKNFVKHPHFTKITKQHMEDMIQEMGKRHMLAVKNNTKYAEELGKALKIIRASRGGNNAG